MATMPPAAVAAVVKKFGAHLGRIIVLLLTLTNFCFFTAQGARSLYGDELVELSNASDSDVQSVEGGSRKWNQFFDQYFENPALMTASQAVPAGMKTSCGKLCRSSVTTRFAYRHTWRIMFPRLLDRTDNFCRDETADVCDINSAKNRLTHRAIIKPKGILLQWKFRPLRVARNHYEMYIRDLACALTFMTVWKDDVLKGVFSATDFGDDGVDGYGEMCESGTHNETGTHKFAIPMAAPKPKKVKGAEKEDVYSAETSRWSMSNMERAREKMQNKDLFVARKAMVVVKYTCSFFYNRNPGIVLSDINVYLPLNVWNSETKVNLVEPSDERCFL
eukprot:TRINITY_DN5579_c0_g4_i1.p1 TRINITY_DN5579_c0_g4~~TRINITY_DN5579_c0_g4_i1.p1  ORF type:complete len:362 (+),score=56.81 TRINITY_DN5579_c0_g4_i1:89-1087(+)